MGSSGRKLRSGYTTGACAAAAAKAAALLLLSAASENKGSEVEIPLPDGSRIKFAVHRSGILKDPRGPSAFASVIKDAGDDPDVTNGAEIMATAMIVEATEGEGEAVLIKGGKGVGIVTKPGLSVPVGELAINPVPRRMIRKAVEEAISECGGSAGGRLIEITISVPWGEDLAKKTLNSRLGIIGGLSILGTTGIVRPLSSEAWTATITASMDVARASGIMEVVLSVGRVSEKAHMKRYKLPEEAYVMMGDYLEFSLAEAKRHNFKKVHISAHWAKMLKISMSAPQTHVRYGVIDITKAKEHLNRLGIAIPEACAFNTAREIYSYLVSEHGISSPLFRKVCVAAKEYAGSLSEGIPVITHLVSYDGDIIADSE